MPAVLAELVVAIATEMVGVKVTVRAWRAEGASVGRLTERKETRAAVTMMIALEAAMAAAGACASVLLGRGIGDGTEG